ncbi:hypothetical protein ThidrDRAFT_2806 [Thiorhodococcus drewsii AZ1]|uniref:Rap1a immunity protein domain-containing protein n=1 Tax=Thiorhodococcus drewsii AZ1 TaxID=765913 RepID=G2E3E3_9GAMM|nr:hypothetical protein [Thiorhodococcus drewsii]EGV30332.1 hypothetical protein ThidrDRAFT_2806 [Thiorhodococcus drewsii AZ1]
MSHASSTSVLRFACLAVAVLCVAPVAWAERAETAPALWGYGVKSCSAFLAVVPRADIPPELIDEEYFRYREWLSGMVSGLNLVTGRDVLRGAQIDAAMSRIRATCEDDPGDDFFNASLRLVRSLGQLKDRSVTE